MHVQDACAGRVGAHTPIIQKLALSHLSILFYLRAPPRPARTPPRPAGRPGGKGEEEGLAETLWGGRTPG